MAWKLPLLHKTAKSLEHASKNVRSRSSASEAARQRYQRVKDLARKRLEMAESVTPDLDVSQQHG